MGKASRGKEQPAPKVSPLKTQVSPFTDLWTQPWTVLLILSLLSILIYSNTFSASFQLDDVTNIVNSLQIRNLSNLPLSESRYVGYLSFALNYHFGRQNVFGYHLVNLLIHIANGFLVYCFVLLLFRIPPPPLTPHALPLTPHPSRLPYDSGIALATSLLFVAHPIQTQAVTYIVQRITSLATLFYLLAVLLYIKWRLTEPESRRQSLWYAGALLSTILAMKTKEISFTLPFMLILVEAIFFGSPTRKQWIALIPFLLMLPIIPLSHSGRIGEVEAGFAKGTTEISRLDYLFTQFRVMLTYVRLLVLPIYQNVDYDYPIAHSLLEPTVLFSFLFLLLLFTFSLYLLFVWPRTPYAFRFTPPATRLVAFGILWFFLTLSVESSIIPIWDVIFEHRLYLPSVGFFLTGSVLISALLERRRGMAAISIGVLVIILSVATYQRNLIWKDEFTLWNDVVQKSPNKTRGHISLGIVYRNQGRLGEALRELEAAIILDPENAAAHINLGNVYSDLGRVDDAIQEYKTASTLRPDYVDPHYDLGIVYQNLGRFDEAIREYQAAIRLDPGLPRPHNNLGRVYFEKGKLPDALEEFEKAVKIAPDFFSAHINLGIIYQKLGQLDEAFQEYKTALILNPNFGEAHFNLGNLYKDLGRQEEAIGEFQAALKLEPDLVDAHYNLGLIYQGTGQIQKAIYEFDQALQINPNYDPAQQALKSLHQ